MQILLVIAEIQVIMRQLYQQIIQITKALLIQSIICNYISFSNMPFIKTHTYIRNQESKLRFRRGCLKTKNILFQNQQVQIGSKVTPIYDFYASEHYLQIQIFIGNKGNNSIDGFKLEYQATPDISIWLQQKNRFIKEKTQYKERLIVGCKNFQSQILLLMNFQCQSVTIKNTAIPISLLSFCVFNESPVIPDHKTKSIKNIIASKFQYTEQNQLIAEPSVFKKGITKELTKFFPSLTQINEKQFIGVFTLRNLIEEYYILVQVNEPNRLSVSLSSNEYRYFDIIFQNLKFFLSNSQ